MRENVFKNLSANMKRIMDANGIKAAGLAEKCHLSAKTIHNILNQEKAPKITTVEDIAFALRVSFWDLVKSPSQDSDSGYEMTIRDKEHIELMEKLSHSEKVDVEKYAYYVMSQRNDS